MANIVSTKGVKFKKLSTGDSVIFDKKGQTFAGRYVGFRKGEYDGRPVMIHILADGETGAEREVWESSALNNLRLLPKGAAVRITFKGMRKSRKGKRRYKDFLLEVEEGVKLKGTKTPF